MRQPSQAGPARLIQKMTTMNDTGADVNRIYGIVAPKVALGLSGLEFLNQIVRGELPSPPFAKTAAMNLIEVSEGRAVFEAHPAETFFNPMGTIHGGWIATVLDSSLGCAVHTTLAAGQLYSTVELSVRLVRKVMPQSGPMTCEGKIVHQGRRIATADARLLDCDGKLAAHGSATCLIFDQKGAV